MQGLGHVLGWPEGAWSGRFCSKTCKAVSFDGSGGVDFGRLHLQVSGQAYEVCTM